MFLVLSLGSCKKSERASPIYERLNGDWVSTETLGLSLTLISAVSDDYVFSYFLMTFEDEDIKADITGDFYVNEKDMTLTLVIYDEEEDEEYSETHKFTLTNNDNTLTLGGEVYERYNSLSQNF